MYFLIGGWGYDERRLRGAQVLPVHDVRLGVHARRHHRHRRAGPPRASADLTFDLVEIAEHADFATSTGALAVLRVRHRLRRQGADVPAAHVAARRAHPGADRRLGDPRRRDAEARHVRPAALRRVPVPRGGALGRPLFLTLAVDRHHLRRHRGDDAEGPQAARRLLVGRPPRLHRARHVRLHLAVDDRRRAADDQPRRCRPARCSSSSG